MKKKRIITPCDNSWIDSFHPRPIKGRKEIPQIEKFILQRNLEKLILVLVFSFLPFSPNYDENEHFSSHFDNNISHLTILSQAKNYVKTDFNKLSVDNLSNFAKEFLKAFTFSDNDRMTIDKATMAQHKNKTCMRRDTF